jgi:hypothetical protein
MMMMTYENYIFRDDMSGTKGRPIRDGDANCTKIEVVNSMLTPI